MRRDEGLSKVHELVHDPRFVEFELEQEAPSVFNAVGRTYTETWHSALLGWLLDPDGSHSLGPFALKRLLLLSRSEDVLPGDGRGIDFDELLAVGDFAGARAQPNERELTEVSVGNMRFDVLVDGIKCAPWEEVQVLVEVKVKARVDKAQNRKYIDYVADRRRNGILVLPVYLAPTSKLIGTPEQVLGDASWLGIDFQSLYDEVVEPCLQHPLVSAFGTFTLSEYVKTLKYPFQGGEALAVTQKDRDLVNALMDDHETAIRALYEILSQSEDDIQPVTPGGAAKQQLKVKIEGTEFEAASVPELYKAVLEFLDGKGCLDNLQLPVATGAKRYLLARSPEHQKGNSFTKIVSHNGYYMEAHKGRAGALNDLGKLLAECGLRMQTG